MKRTIAIMIILILSIPSIYANTSEKANNKTIYVDDDGGADFTGIQEAIDAANEGDTIFVYNGIYNEYIKIKKSLNLFGESKENTIIDAEENRTGNYPAVIYILKDDVRIKNFSVMNSGLAGYGIKVNSDGIEISNCIILNNYESIWLWSSNNSRIYKNQIINNTFGIMVYFSKDTIFKDNEIFGDNMEGVSLYYSNDIIIQNNKIFNNRGNGIQLSDTYSIQIRNNLIENNWYGIVTDTSEFDSIQGNFILNNIVGLIFGPSNFSIINRNTIQNNQNGGIRLFSNSTANTFYHNNFINNSLNAGSFETYNNTWDNGKIGNYWDDYKGIDENADGIGDTPYYISGGNQLDRYPLMEPKNTTNNPPNKPTINGPTRGKTGSLYSYNFTAFDQDNDKIYYTIDFDNGSSSSTRGPFYSGYTLTTSTVWTQQGTYTIRAKAKDEYGLESDWSILEVTMPKSKVSLWEQLVERWPIFERFINNIWWD